LVIVFGLTTGSQERAVRLKEVENLASGNRDSKKGETLQQFCMHFIHALVLAQTKLSHQQHDV
jgi:hypothetical protein